MGLMLNPLFEGKTMIVKNKKIEKTETPERFHPLMFLTQAHFIEGMETKAKQVQELEANRD